MVPYEDHLPPTNTFSGSPGKHFWNTVGHTFIMPPVTLKNSGVPALREISGTGTWEGALDGGGGLVTSTRNSQDLLI